MPSPRQHLERLLDRLAVRPLTFVVFVVSALLLGVLQFGGLGTVPMRGVASARPIEHPAHIDSSIEAVHVQAGDEVKAGTPLVTLSPTATSRALQLIEAEIAALDAELALEQAKIAHEAVGDGLRVQRELLDATRDLSDAEADEKEAKARVKGVEQRVDDARARVEARTAARAELVDLEAELVAVRGEAERARRYVDAARRLKQSWEAIEADLLGVASEPKPAPSSGSRLERRTLEAYVAQIAALGVQADALREDLENTTVVARSDGRVALVLPIGSPVPVGTSVATLLPQAPTEIVAYVEAKQIPRGIAVGQSIAVVDPEGCRGRAELTRVGAAVEMGPPQLYNLLYQPIFGVPLYATVPDDCPLIVGQVLELELELGSEP